MALRGCGGRHASLGMLFLAAISSSGVARGLALNATSSMFSAALAIALLKEPLS